LCDTFEEDCDQGELGKDSGSLASFNSCFIKDLQVIFGCAIQSFGGGPEGSEFLVAMGTGDDFSDESGMLSDRHMFNETMVVDEIGTGLGVFF